MQINELLAKAWAEVEASSVPEHVQAKAFELAVARLSATTVTPVPSPETQNDDGGAETPDENGGSAAVSDKAATGLFEKLANESGIPADLWSEVVYFDENGPKLNKTWAKLGKNKSEACKRVAIILTGAFEYALDTLETDGKYIRSECKRLKCFNTNNFASYMGATTGLQGTGPSTTRKYKLKGAGSGNKALREAIEDVCDKTQ